MQELLLIGEWDKVQKFKNLEPGEVKILRASNDRVFTVLGSCVSVIFHVPKLLSLICHAQMPTQSKIEYKNHDSSAPNYFKSGTDSSDLIYTNSSIDYMVSVLLKSKVNLKNIHTTILGGASMFTNLDNNNSIGSQNIAVAKNILAMHRIKINRELIGGNYGLTVWYYASNNKLIVNRHPENKKFELLDVKYPSLITP